MHPALPSPRPALALALACIAALGLGGCGWLPREPVVPMPTQLDRAECASGARADTLLVLLPGRGMTTGELAREGFVQAVRARGLAVDVLRADAHLAYYENRSIVQRLQQDVISPARARGYRSIWLAGISLGGMGALIYDGAQHGEIAGIVAIAPYLGEPAVLDEIAGAGGLRRWSPAAELGDRAPETLDELTRRLWLDLKPYAEHADPPGRPPLYLAYGSGDRLAAGHRLLAAALPPGRVFTTNGGHDWAPWQRLWRSVLEALPLPRCDAAPS